MSKLRPLRKAEEMQAIPVDQPILVELDPAPTGTEVVSATEPEPTTPARSDDTQADPSKSLQDQLEAMKAADKLRQGELDRKEQERREAVQLAETRTRELQEARAGQADTERDLVVNSLQGAQAEASAAELAYAKAFELGDAMGSAKAQAAMARSQAKILAYEGAQADIEQRRERETAQATQQPRQQQSVSPEQMIDNHTGLMAQEKAWLKSHMDAWLDTSRNNELSVAYQRATREGHVRGTPQYFQYLENFMGYTKPTQRSETQDEGTTIVAAPVTRDPVSHSTGQPSSTRVHLTAEMREMAKSMGLTDVQYAAQVARLQQEKKSNPEKYRG